MGFIIFYILTTCLFLQFIPNKISFSKEVQKVEKDNGPTEPVPYANSSKLRAATVTVRLLDLKLSVEKYVLFRKTTVNILQDIAADFEPGKLNIIMGPSGISHGLETLLMERFWEK